MTRASERSFVVGTRGSALALWQTRYIISRLEAAHPSRSFLLKTIRTSGDADQRSALAEIGTRGVFVKEIQNALLSGEIDLGVHSLKDLPSETHPGLTLAAVGPREDPRDALVGHDGHDVDGLPRGARVGTGSPRRASQLKAYRPDLQMENIRGNVDTRVRKALEGDYDAVVLAAAGLIRLGRRDRIAQYIPISLMLPAPGQGIVALETRAADQETIDIVAAIDDGPAHLAARAERAFVRALGGGCTTPLAAYTSVLGERLQLEGLLAATDGTRMIKKTLEGAVASPERLGEQLAALILSAGGREILTDLGGAGMGADSG